MAQNLSQKLTEQLSPPQTTRQRQLETLLGVSRAIGTILDPAELFERIMTHVTAAFGADRSTLFLHDAPKGELWSSVAQGLDDAWKHIRLPDDKGIAGEVFQSHESLLIPDTFKHRQFARELAERTGYVPRSMLVVPIAHRPGRSLGVLQVMDRELNYFKDDDLELLEAIAVQVGISVENAQLHVAQRRQFASFVRSFSAALDARDSCTQIHSINVANYAQGIGYYLGLPAGELEWLRLAGLLHDVGKIGTPERILTKPGKLNALEFEQMKEHAADTRAILSQIEFVPEFEGMDVEAAAHHERLDGSGYPLGLRANQISLRVRILAVADVFHAITQDRHYRPGMDPNKALSIVESMTPHQLDRECVDAIKRFLGVPPGPSSNAQAA